MDEFETTEHNIQVYGRIQNDGEFIVYEDEEAEKTVFEVFDGGQLARSSLNRVNLSKNELREQIELIEDSHLLVDEVKSIEWPEG